MLLEIIIYQYCQFRLIGEKLELEHVTEFEWNFWKARKISISQNQRQKITLKMFVPVKPFKTNFISAEMSEVCSEIYLLMSQRYEILE